MKPKFEFYELVEVRNHDGQVWQKRCLLWVLPDNKGCWCMRQGQDETNYNGQPVKWNQIRKIQPAEEHNKKMKEEFTYGELVEVRDYDDHKWEKHVYVGRLPYTKRYYTMFDVQDETNYDGRLIGWEQIRKIQPKPEPEPIEQRMDKFEANFNSAIKSINERFDSIAERGF